VSKVTSANPDRAGPAVLTMPGAPPAFHVMAKPTGAVCNLDCGYCFYLSKEMPYPGSRFTMAAGLQATYIRQLLAAHARAPEVVVAWQGGEPTMMGLDFFRRSVEFRSRQRADAGDVGAAALRPPARRPDDGLGQAEARRGRNETCTWASGRKWTYCHGAPLESLMSSG